IVDASSEGCNEVWVTRPRAWRRALQCLADHVLRLHRSAKQNRCNTRHFCALLVEGSGSGKRRRRADALQRRRLARLPNPTGEKGDVRTLTATVRMQLVEDEELKPACGLDELALERPREDQL